MPPYSIADISQPIRSLPHRIDQSEESPNYVKGKFTKSGLPATIHTKSMTPANRWLSWLPEELAIEFVCKQADKTRIAVYYIEIFDNRLYISRPLNLCVDKVFAWRSIRFPVRINFPIAHQYYSTKRSHTKFYCHLILLLGAITLSFSY